MDHDGHVLRLPAFARRFAGLDLYRFPRFARRHEFVTGASGLSASINGPRVAFSDSGSVSEAIDLRFWRKQSLGAGWYRGLGGTGEGFPFLDDANKCTRRPSL